MPIALAPRGALWRASMLQVTQVRSGQLRRVGVVADLIVGDDDEEVDVAPVVRVSAAEGSDEPCGADRRVSFEAFDRPPEPRLADRTEVARDPEDEGPEEGAKAP
jgi:hypothetical protein